MSRPTKHARPRCGVTLLEVMISAAIAGALMTSSFVVLRSSFTAWRAHEADLDRAGQASALLRHIVRHARQSAGVAAVSPATDASGSLSVVRDDGTSFSWDHAGTSVTLQLDGATPQPLADDIQELRFEPLQADGLTPAADPADARLLRVSVLTQQPAGGTRAVSSYVWVRSW